jgi:hypothetical protein
MWLLGDTTKKPVPIDTELVDELSCSRETTHLSKSELKDDVCPYTNLQEPKSHTAKKRSNFMSNFYARNLDESTTFA